MITISARVRRVSDWTDFSDIVEEQEIVSYRNLGIFHVLINIFIVQWHNTQQILV